MGTVRGGTMSRCGDVAWRLEWDNRSCWPGAEASARFDNLPDLGVAQAVSPLADGLESVALAAGPGHG